MTTQTEEALKMALAALELEEAQTHYPPQGLIKAIKACKEALELEQLDEIQAITVKEYSQQEPVAWQWLKSGHMRKKIPKTATPEHWRPLYTHPKEWQELSNDRIREIGDTCLENNRGLFNWIDFARAIEQVLKEKNA